MGLIQKKVVLCSFSIELIKKSNPIYVPMPPILPEQDMEILSPLPYFC